MPNLDPQNFESQLASQSIPGLVLLHGEEDFLIREALDSIIPTALGSEGLKDFNLDIFYAQVDDTTKVRDAVETLPMMASRRVVVLKEAQHLKAKDYETLLPIVESPVDSTVFIIVSTGADQRLKFFKKLIQKGWAVKFQRPYENQMAQWVHKIATRHGKKLTPEANLLLQRLVGTNLTDIDNEMRKLSQYTHEQEPIDVEDVRQVVSTLRTDTVFQLAHAIGANDRSQALTCLANLLEHGESPIGILALVSRHIRILSLVREGLHEGLSNAQLSSKAGVPSFFLRQYLDQSRQWSDEKIRHAYQALMNTDRALKSSPITPHIWLENFILKACGAIA